MNVIDWTVLFATLVLIVSWQGYKLNERKYQDEQQEKSRPKMKIVHKGDGKVEITVEQIDDLSPARGPPPAEPAQGYTRKTVVAQQIEVDSQHELACFDVADYC